MFKQITLENIEEEHICCCITDKKGENQVGSKKAWLKERLPEGLVFYKLDVRGKVFIEYIPAEYAWAPIEADDYMYIDCLWVSGQYKGQGYSDELLQHCITDSKQKGKKGLVCLSSEKKMPYLSDSKFLKYKGFQLADTSGSYFQLYYLPFQEDAEIPKIKESAKQGKIDEQGLVLYYTNQCPFTDKYAPQLAAMANQHGFECALHKIETKELAQALPVPVTTYALFYNGEFVTHEILSEKSFKKLVDSHLAL